MKLQRSVNAINGMQVTIGLLFLYHDQRI